MKKTKKPDATTQTHREDDTKDNPAPGSLRREFLVTTSLSAAGLVVACGDDSTPLPDASAGMDGGPGPDATLSDAAADVPTSDAADAMAPGDAGPDPDAGTDAGAGGPELTPENDADFPMGVSAGDAHETSAVLWTYYTGASMLQLGVWRWDGSEYGERVVDAAAPAADGGFVHVPVMGLAAGERFRYAFFELEGDEEVRRSPLGTFRCAIAADAQEVIRFGAVSCTRNDLASFPALRQAGTRTDLDAFLLLGDTTYNDGATSIAQFRTKWAENLSRSEYKDLFASVGVYATWDDHEVTNNWNIESIAPATLEAARQAFWEHLPLRRVEEDESRIWRSHKWGNTVEVFVLDCRSERRPSQAEYISRAQMDWLKAGLSASTARFKVIMNSVGITRFPFTIAANDRWQAYTAQRTEILEHIDAGIEGVFWVAGDFHFTCLAHVGQNTDAVGWNQYEVLVGPGAQATNPGHLVCRPPQFPMSSGARNYVELTFDPAAGEITIRWFGEGGVVFDTRTIAV